MSSRRRDASARTSSRTGWRFALAARIAFVALALAALLAIGRTARAADDPAPAPASSVRPPTAAPPAETTLADVLRLAREANPRAELARAAVALADADRRSAAEFPNPSLAFGREKPHGGEQTLFTGDYLNDVSLDVPLPAPGLRGARKRAADQALDAAQSGAQARVNSLAADAGAAFLALLRSQQDVAVLANAQSELERLHDVVAARRAAGVASEYDLLRLDVEVATWRSRLDEARTDVLDKQAELAALLGFAGWRPVAVGELGSLADELRRFETGEFDLATHPALVAAAAQQASAETKVEVAERERWPAFSVDYDHNKTVDPYGASQRFGLTVEVPIGNTRRGALDHARVEADQAALERRLTEAELGTDVARSEAVAAQRQQVLERFDAQVGRRLPQLQDMAEVAYRLGNTPIVELLDAARTRYEAQLDQATLRAELAQARLDVAAARGALGTRDPP
jgi:cobalt-zinc-cadmium efflux system outer membrane protein